MRCICILAEPTQFYDKFLDTGIRYTKQMLVWHVLSPAHIAHSFHGYPEVRHLIHKALPLPNKNPNKWTMVNPPRSSRRPPPQALNDIMSYIYKASQLYSFIWVLHDLCCLLCDMNLVFTFGRSMEDRNRCKPTHDMKEVFGPTFSQDRDGCLSVIQSVNLWLCILYSEGWKGFKYFSTLYVRFLEISVSLGMVAISWKELSEGIVVPLA